jgi:outer membrane protein OmpA-like peptidoglycan-associated protein
MNTKHLLIMLAVALPVSASAENLNTPQPRQQDKLQVAKVTSFDFGKIYVHGEEREELQRIANLWRQRRHWWTITVEGNGFVANNEEASIQLGEKRAQRVRDLLVKYGVDPRFVIAVGNSREEPGRYVDVTVDTCARCRR